MKKRMILILSLAFTYQATGHAQTKTASTTADVAFTKAELGTFPYLKSLPNTYPRNSSDSVTLDQNIVYVHDGKKIISVEGKVSKQELSIKNSKAGNYSVSQLISEYNKVITTLGGQKIFEGKLNEATLLAAAGSKDFVSLSSKGQLVGGAFQGIAQYLIKTPEKEIWVQLQPYSILSGYYNLLIVEKENKLIFGNINKENKLLTDLEKGGTAVIKLSFEPDKETLLSESKDELLQIVNVFQTHKDWKLRVEIHSAPIGKPEYTLALTEKRAAALKSELNSLGVKGDQIIINGLGDSKPLMPNETEAARIKNTRVEIKKS